MIAIIATQDGLMLLLNAIYIGIVKLDSIPCVFSGFGREWARK